MRGPHQANSCRITEGVIDFRCVVAEGHKPEALAKELRMDFRLVSRSAFNSVGRHLRRSRRVRRRGLRHNRRAHPRRLRAWDELH